MRFWTRVLSLSAVAILLMGGQCQHTKEMTSGICAWVKDNIVEAKKTDAFDTKKASASQIKWYRDNCL